VRAIIHRHRVAVFAAERVYFASHTRESSDADLAERFVAD
jgi:hypothetical protein